MRASCEQCRHLQPIDWKPGDLCVHCGRTARQEVRCAWCARWTPAASYCRECGFEIVAERLYGAARMLKHGGVDQFAIPKQVTSFDPAQIDNFTRLYQRHAIVVARHAEQLTFLQQFLRHTHWAAELEDRLTVQLPWTDDELSRFSSAPIELLGSTHAERIRTIVLIQESTPFEATRSVAAVARVRLDDWSALAGAHAAINSPDESIRSEAALAVTSWRVFAGAGSFEGGLQPALDVLRTLRTSVFADQAQIRLAALTADQVAVAAEAIGSIEAETSLGAALVIGDIDRLDAALSGDVIERCAAGAALARLGVLTPLVAIVRSGPDEVRAAILHPLSNANRPVSALTDVLVDVVETTSDDAVRQLAARVAAPTMTVTDALRVVRIAVAKSDRRILQSILQRTNLQPHEPGVVLDELITSGSFTIQQYGMSTIAEDGRLEDSFVPTRFSHAPLEVRPDLLALAELQLCARGDEMLHQFVIGVVFGDGPSEVRTTAWWVLHRWYMSQGDHRGEGPFRLELDVVCRFFGTIDAFVPRLAVVLRDTDASNDVAYSEFVANILGSADPAFIETVLTTNRARVGLIEALIESLANAARINVAEAIMVFMSKIGARGPERATTLDAVRRFDRRGNHHYDTSIRRLQLAEFGIPFDDEWSTLPIDFVPTHWPSTITAAGQMAMLDVAAHQLNNVVDGVPVTALLGVLAEVGENGASDAIRRRAGAIHEQHTGYGAPSFDRPD